MAKTCQCGNNIPRSVKIDGKFRNLKNRTKCLDCLPFGSSNYRKKTDEEVRTAMAMKAKRCYDAFKKKHGVDYITFYRLRRREAILTLIGKACQGCGYNRLTKNLAFHHLSDKEFGLSAREFQYSFKKLYEELTKCVIICHNCHGEVHEEIRTLEDVNKWHQTFMAVLEPTKGMTWDQVFRYVGMPTNEEALNAIDN